MNPYYHAADQFIGMCFDEYVRLFLVNWYWPNFVMGNFDDWQKLGITLNGAKPLCKP